MAELLISYRQLRHREFAQFFFGQRQQFFRGLPITEFELRENASDLGHSLQNSRETPTPPREELRQRGPEGSTTESAIRSVSNFSAARSRAPRSGRQPVHDHDCFLTPLEENSGPHVHSWAARRQNLLQCRRPIVVAPQIGAFTSDDR